MSAHGMTRALDAAKALEASNAYRMPAHALTCSCGHAVTRHHAVQAKSGAVFHVGHCVAILNGGFVDGVIVTRRCPCKGPR
jgi:hypothetical protein